MKSRYSSRSTSRIRLCLRSMSLRAEITSFSDADVAEAWAVLSAETGFVEVGTTDGHFLINTDLVELAFIRDTLGGVPQYVFRIQGRDYTFDDPGKFDFSPLTGAAASPAVSAAAAPGAVTRKTR